LYSSSQEKELSGTWVAGPKAFKYVTFLWSGFYDPGPVHTRKDNSRAIPMLVFEAENGPDSGFLCLNQALMIKKRTFFISQSRFIFINSVLLMNQKYKKNRTMRYTGRISILIFSLLLGQTEYGRAQSGEDPDNEHAHLKKSKFLTGVYIGSYFANNNTASAYNGYGFDPDGNRNLFVNSLMYQKIINEYGGRYGQPDMIAAALGVDQGQWDFNESDMPTNMRYVPSIMVGLNFKLPVTKKSAFIFNVNAARLGIEGNFTISTLRPPTTNPAFNNNIHVFGIRGSEQRLLFQLGFQQVFGVSDKINVFAELGLNATLTKYDRNTIFINGLQIDLMHYVNQTLYPSPYPYRRPVGFGIGAFAGLGVNMEVNPKITLQFLYSPSHERVKIANSSNLKLQHALGMRVYYKL
jgi:hypothetical protein